MWANEIYSQGTEFPESVYELAQAPRKAVVAVDNHTVDSCGALIHDGERSFALNLILHALVSNSLLG